MKHVATTWLAALVCVLLTLPSLAQPVRNGVDVVWAKDVGDIEMTLDGVLDEAAWANAEALVFAWNEPPGGLPGSGQKIEGEPVLAEPTDPASGTLYILREGNMLWMGLDVQDASIGGGTSLFNFDGFIMSLLDRSQRPDAAEFGNNFFANGALNAEFFLTYWNPADTTDAEATYADGTVIGSGQTSPGSSVRGFGDYGVGFSEGLDGEARTEEDRAIWDFADTVDGITNDDTHGDDVGYVLETRIDLGALGYDFTQPGGDQVPFNFALEDQDFYWPTDPDISFRSRVWFQNQWGNNFNEGVAYIYGAPDVTVASASVPEVTDPEFTIYDAGTVDAPTLDGSLDDAIWGEFDPQFGIRYQMTLDEAMATMPGSLAPYHISFFRPDINGEADDAIVVDPSIARVQMVHDNTMLYIGVDVEDQAISGAASENGRDGIRFTMRRVDSLLSQQTLASYQFDFYIDSTGTLQYANDALGLQDEAPGAVTGAVFLKGASSAADPTDVDEGYQMEIAIDLAEALGYEAPLGERGLWLAMNFFDGDYLETLEASYAMRTWLLGERGSGGSLYGYLSDTRTVAVDDAVEVPTQLKLMGNYPNPFNPSTTIRYALPQAAEVTVQVFDVLGRQVAALKPGVQGAGANEIAFDAAQLASGVYLYRVQTVDLVTGTLQAAATGQMLLLK